MSADLLQRIQQLQFTNRGEAEALLLDFISSTFPLEVQSVELRPQVISLNSFNGFLILKNGEKLFFKTHTEEDNVIGEYYNARMLADVGYPIIQPIHSSTKAGQHLLIYEVIESPSVFDLAWDIENNQSNGQLDALVKAQNQSDDSLFQYYMTTLKQQSGEVAAKAPIHQLFYHRITGGRMTRFYSENTYIQLPDGKNYAIPELFNYKWVINGQQYNESIYSLLKTITPLLNPNQDGPSIIGHGDAHNGNVFFQNDAPLLYFDPAFAGQHHPLLDLTKPLFHNVFAMWMYFPDVKRDKSKITLNCENNTLYVDYDYTLPPLRHMFLQSKLDRVLIPILQELKSRDWLRTDWRHYLKAALFCCPFLTLNLADHKRFSPEISLLGLAMAMEMGAESKQQHSLIDRKLDEVEARI